MKFEKIVKFSPPFDKRHKNPSKNYGIGALKIWFILKKGEKAVQVLLATNSYPASVIREYQTKHPDMMLREGDYEGWTCYDVGYHSNTPTYKEQTSGSCDLLKKGECYYDGSSLRGKDNKIAENFFLHGEDWVWNYLEKYWNSMFGK